MKKFLFTLVLLLTALAPVMGQSSACEAGSQSPAIGFWIWAPESAVKVYVFQTDFQETELPFLLAPLASWNSVSVATGSRVTFEYKGTTKDPLYCQNCLTIKRGHVFEKSKRHLTELNSYSVPNSSRLLAWATIVVDPRLTNPGTLTNAVAHELGHTFGLLDCYSCKQKSSVMRQFKSVNVSNEMNGPTACDVAQVKSAYESLAIQLKHAAKAKKEIDEGEEPVDDDTPIVVPRP